MIRCSESASEKLRSLEAGNHTDYREVEGTEAAAVVPIRALSETLLNVDLEAYQRIEARCTACCMHAVRRRWSRFVPGKFSWFTAQLQR
jgi:hypothetical protein